MNVETVDVGEALADPWSAAWKHVSSEAVPLGPVDYDAQPNAYIRAAWKDRPYGQTVEARVGAAQAGGRLYVRLEWPDDPSPNAEFPDAAGAVFPMNGSGALATMGDTEKPLALWFWEDGRSSPLRLIARGPGVFSKDDAGELSASGSCSDGAWGVVFAGPASMAGKGKLGIAIWNGSNEERAGLAAVSKDWLSLETTG
jgi:steroid C-25 hydroxylase gamma subunit